MISNEQLAALDALAKEATKGFAGFPWQVTMARNEDGVTGYYVRGHCEAGIAVVRDQYWDDDYNPPRDDYGYFQPDENMDCLPVRVDIAKFIAAANPTVIRALIAEIMEYRHLCAQVRVVYDSDSGFGEGMVISCHRESQRKDTQAVAAMLIWQQPADESADLRIGIRADMT